MTRIAIIGNPGSWSSEHLRDTAERLAGDAVLVDPAHLSIDLEHGRVRAGDVELNGFDAVILKKIGDGYRPEYVDRLDVLRFLHASGTPIFSDPTRVQQVIDRLACTVTLAAHGVAMAPTFVTERVEEAEEAVVRFGRAVAKPLFTSKGRGMVVLDAQTAFRPALESFHAAGNGVLYIQKLLDLPGFDLGLVFLGGEYVTTYARRGADGSWNTAVHEGGRYAPYDPPPEVVELARQAQAPFELDFTCVDVAETEMGPVVWEVSAFGGFRGLREARGLDAAEMYVSHVLDRIGAGVAP